MTPPSRNRCARLVNTTVSHLKWVLLRWPAIVSHNSFPTGQRSAAFRGRRWLPRYLGFTAAFIRVFRAANTVRCRNVMPSRLCIASTLSVARAPSPCDNNSAWCPATGGVSNVQFKGSTMQFEQH